MWKSSNQWGKTCCLCGKSAIDFGFSIFTDSSSGIIQVYRVGSLNGVFLWKYDDFKSSSYWYISEGAGVHGYLLIKATSSTI